MLVSCVCLYWLRYDMCVFFFCCLVAGLSKKLGEGTETSAEHNSLVSHQRLTFPHCLEIKLFLHWVKMPHILQASVGNYCQWSCVFFNVGQKCFILALNCNLPFVLGIEFIHISLYGDSFS